MPTGIREVMLITIRQVDGLRSHQFIIVDLTFFLVESEKSQPKVSVLDDGNYDVPLFVWT